MEYGKTTDLMKLQKKQIYAQSYHETFSVKYHKTTYLMKLQKKLQIQAQSYHKTT